MLPEFYRTNLSSQLSRSQLLTLEILVWLLQVHNLFLVAVIIDRRALPIYWQFLEKLGASNLAEQQALLRPVLKLLKKYELVVLGDREFHSVTLAAWLKNQQVYFVFRQKKDTNIKFPRQAYQQLNYFGYSPGMKLFLTGIKCSKIVKVEVTI
jgi:hypothetical protein